MVHHKLKLKHSQGRLADKLIISRLMRLLLGSGLLSSLLGLGLLQLLLVGGEVSRGVALDGHVSRISRKTAIFVTEVLGISRLLLGHSVNMLGGHISQQNINLSAQEGH